MTKLCAVFFIIALAVVVSAAPLAAQPPKGKNKMAAMDLNKDGKVSKEEFVKYHEASFKGLDKNSDGYLDGAECSAAGKGGKKKGKQGKANQD